MIQFIPAFLNDYMDVPLNRQIAAMLEYYFGRLQAQVQRQTRMRFIDFTSDRDFPLVFAPDETGVSSNQINVRVEGLKEIDGLTDTDARAGGSYVSRNDTVVIDGDGTIRVQAVQPFDGRITVWTNYEPDSGGDDGDIRDIGDVGDGDDDAAGRFAEHAKYKFTGSDFIEIVEILKGENK